MGKVAPVSGVAKLFLEINGDRYTVIPIEADPEVAMVAWRLTSMAGKVYDVRRDEHGFPSCDCYDFLYRRENRDPKGCKHVAALVATKLM